MPRFLPFAKTILSVLLPAALFVIAGSGCASMSTPPGADVTAGGVFEQTGFEFLRWEEGLAIMIWHDFVGESGSFSTSESTGFTTDPIYKLQGYAESRDGDRFDWEVQTNDGKTAQFWLDGTSYDLSAGGLFIVTMKNGGADVTQLDRDLSSVQPTYSSCLAFAEGDPDLARFIGDRTVSTVASLTSVPNPTPTLQAPSPTVESPIPTSSPTLPPPTATPTPPLPTPTVTPLPPMFTPTTVPTIERIQFAPGATQTTVEGYLPANGSKVYVMRVGAGQFTEMDATVDTTGQGLRFSIVGANGTVVRAMGEAHVRTVVPSTQDYYVELVSDAGAVSYRMSVLIPVRIRFASGATSAEVVGSLAANGMRHYVLRALAGQRMIVAPRATQGQVGLVISGADGQVLLSGRVGRPGGVYDSILPTTQDYLIAMRAEGGTGADYILERLFGISHDARRGRQSTARIRGLSSPLSEETRRNPRDPLEITIPAEEAESGITIMGTVVDVSLSARIIMLREPVEGFGVIALTEESELTSPDGSEITLRDIQPGMTIQASGQPGESNALLASQVLLLDAIPTPPPD